MQATRLNRLSGQLLSRLSQWAENPWRRFSLLLLVLLAGFSAGVSIGSVAFPAYSPLGPGACRRDSAGRRPDEALSEADRIGDLWGQVHCSRSARSGLPASIACGPSDRFPGCRRSAASIRVAAPDSAGPGTSRAPS